MCAYDVSMPIVLETMDGRGVEAESTAPAVDNSELPALLGLETMIEHSAVL